MTRRRSGLRLVFCLLFGAGWTGGAAAQGREQAGPKLDAEAYEGWRQYSAHCARCHGQDVLGNPVAADLLKTTAAGGPVAEKAAFVAAVKTGRPNRGMPGFAKVIDDAQANAIFAYVKGRADGKIPAGRPERAGGK
jgi:mono/diheme cytochrome c family protein